MASETAPLATRSRSLVTWFARHARTFPWRENRTPYRVWIAETMLQQTRAATVVPYFEAWMTRFPDLDALARAPRSDVLATWQGLGYYRRARALHEAAVHLVRDHGGAFPTTETGWRALPGIGSYTAAAILAFAQGERTVAIDGNVRRVAARLLAHPAPKDAEIREALLPLLPRRQPERGTEALIELGATVCTPRQPRCPACPLAPACQAHQQDAVLAYPAPRPRRTPPTRNRYALVHLRDHEILLERRPDEGLLGGLWGFPQTETLPTGRALPALRHAYTHFTLHLTPIVTPETPSTLNDATRWTSVHQLETLPLSNVDRRVLDLLDDEGLLASTS